MGALLKKLFDIVLTGSIKKMLVGAGLTLSSGALSFAVINFYINKLLGYLSGIGGSFGSSLIALFGIAGLDTALSIIIGAYVVKFTIKKAQVFLSKL